MSDDEIRYGDPDPVATVLRGQKLKMDVDRERAKLLQPGPEPPETLPDPVIPEGVPVTPCEWVHGPFVLRVIEEDEKDPSQLIAPEGGWETQQEAIDWLAQSGLDKRGGKGDFDWAKPWLGMRFEILALREPPSFLQYCSW